LKFDYNNHCNLFKTVLLVGKNVHSLFRPKTNSGSKNASFFAGEEDRMTSVDSNYIFSAWMSTWN